MVTMMEVSVVAAVSTTAEADSTARGSLKTTDPKGPGVRLADTAEEALVATTSGVDLVAAITAEVAEVSPIKTATVVVVGTSIPAATPEVVTVAVAVTAPEVGVMAQAVTAPEAAVVGVMAQAATTKTNLLEDMATSRAILLQRETLRPTVAGA